MKLYGSHSSRKRRGGSHNSVPAMKGYFLEKHKPSTSYTYIEIGDDMGFEWHDGISCVSGRSYSGRSLGSKDHVWNTYVIHYSYRECEHMCDKWSKERWDEVCTQKH